MITRNTSTRVNNKKRLTIGLIIVLIFSVFSNLYAQELGLRNIGPQIYSTVVQASTFSRDSNGQLYVFTVVRGSPAYMVGFKVGDKTPEFSFPLHNNGGSWDMTTASDGSIYMTGDRSIFRYVIGDTSVTDLGVVLPEEKSVWALASGKSAELFGGTFPGGKIFRYSISEGFTDYGNGSLVKDEQYVRSLAFQQKTGLLYAGIGSRAHLIEYDSAKGTKNNLLPSPFSEYQFVYDLKIIEDVDGKDYLFAWLKGAGKSPLTLVFDLTTKQLVKELRSDIKIKSIVKGIKDTQIYYTANKELYSIDLLNKSSKPILLSSQFGDSYSMMWDTDSATLISFKDSGNLVKFNLLTNNLLEIGLLLPKQPMPIHTLLAAPDGRIWSSGFLSGGNSAYDPGTDSSIEYRGLSQAEGMLASNSNIFFGLYTGANFYKYNITKPWSLTKKSPEFIGNVEGQDRPFGAAESKVNKKVFFGTVPSYGKLGGDLVEFDDQGNAMQTYRNIVPQQSIVSLMEYKGLLIGGTSTSGGLGIEPAEKEAKLFFWDVKKKQIVFQFIPVKGARSVTGLSLDNMGNVWGMADGTLFVFDPVKKKVIKKRIIHSVASSGQIWRNGSFAFHPSGDVYGTSFNGFFKVNPKTLQIDVIKEGGLSLVMDVSNNLYFIEKGNLWRYSPVKQDF